MSPFDVPQQHSHRAYVQAVADALEAAGMPVVEVDFPADDGDLLLLRRAWLVLGGQATRPVYGNRVVSLLWDEEEGWALGWGPNCDYVTERVRVSRRVLALPYEVVGAVAAGTVASPDRPVRGQQRAHDDFDERFEAELDFYTAAHGGGCPPPPGVEDAGVAAVLQQMASLTGLVTTRYGADSVPGRVENRGAVARLLRLARAIQGDEEWARARVAWHLAVLALWCPRPEAHHAHEGEAAVWAADVPLLIAQDVAAGHYSIRGLAQRYCHLGADREMVRRVLGGLVPAYAWGSEARFGRQRVTVLNHAANRARRRKDLRYVPREDVRDRRSALLCSLARPGVDVSF